MVPGVISDARVPEPMGDEGDEGPVRDEGQLGGEEQVERVD